MTFSPPDTVDPAQDKLQFCAKFGKIGTLQHTPAQIDWSEIHSSICDTDQLLQTPLTELLLRKFGAVNFSIRWCQVDVSQRKCLCFDIDIKHEDSLPLSFTCESLPLTIQHQCPFAEAFRAEIPIADTETRRDHWNRVIAQQMIPKEGRVSHLSFEPDKKQAARRYYDLRTATIDLTEEHTNVITIASQPPAWFFSPKELTLPLKDCLHEIKYCDNSFIQESFMTNADIIELKLRHREFLRHCDYGKWIFCHLVLAPEQCFHLFSLLIFLFSLPLPCPYCRKFDF
jgi:hypothetical protein